MVADGLRGKRVSVRESAGLPFLPPQSLLTQGRVSQRVKQRSPGSAGERARALRRLRGVMRRWPLCVLLRVQMRTSQKVPLRASARSRAVQLSPPPGALAHQRCPVHGSCRCPPVLAAPRSAAACWPGSHGPRGWNRGVRGLRGCASLAHRSQSSPSSNRVTSLWRPIGDPCISWLVCHLADT